MREGSWVSFCGGTPMSVSGWQLRASSPLWGFSPSIGQRGTGGGSRQTEAHRDSLFDPGLSFLPEDDGLSKRVLFELFPVSTPKRARCSNAGSPFVHRGA